MIPETILPTATIQFESPDVLVTRVTAERVDGASVLGVAKVAAELFEQRPDIYWLSLNGNAKGLTPDAKPVFKTLPALRPYAYVGVVESFVTRTWVQMLMRGLVLIGRMGGKVELFGTEMEARVWIAADRASRASELRS